MNPNIDLNAAFAGLYGDKPEPMALPRFMDTARDFIILGRNHYLYSIPEIQTYLELQEKDLQIRSGFPGAVTYGKDENGRDLHIVTDMRFELTNSNKERMGLFHTLKTITDWEWDAVVREFCSHIIEKQRNPAGIIKTVADIPCIEDLDVDIEFVCQFFIRRGITAFTGKSGDGKTTLSDFLAWMEWKKNGIPSLILDRENPASIVKKRLARLDITTGEGFRYWGTWTGDPPPHADDPRVLDWAKQTQGIVRFDSWTSYLENGDANSATDNRVLADRMRKITDVGGTVEIIHHPGKAETAQKFRGSSDFVAA